MANAQGQQVAVTAAAFDLEGTIVDLELLHHSSHLRAAAEHCINLSWEEAVLRLPHFIGGPDEQVASELAALAPNRVNAEDLLRAKREYFRKQFAKVDRIHVRPGFMEFLKWIMGEGIMISVGSATNREFAEVLLRRTGLASYLPDVRLVAREDVEHPKPSPDVYIRTAGLCGVSCREQLVFEDSPVGVKAAHLAGCRVLAVPTVHTPTIARRLMSEGAEALFSEWDDPELRIHVSQIIMTRHPAALRRGKPRA